MSDFHKRWDDKNIKNIYDKGRIFDSKDLCELNKKIRVKNIIKKIAIGALIGGVGLYLKTKKLK